MSVASGVASRVAPRDRSGLLLLAPVAAAVAMAVFLVLPYYVNDLHHVPLLEVTGGAHDPHGLWPYADGGPLAVVLSWGAFAAIVLAPFAAGVAALAAVIDLKSTQKPYRRVGRSLATVVLALGVLAWLVTPLGGGLVAWWFD